MKQVVSFMRDLTAEEVVEYANKAKGYRNELNAIEEAYDEAKALHKVKSKEKQEQLDEVYRCIEYQKEQVEMEVMVTDFPEEGKRRYYAITAAGNKGEMVHEIDLTAGTQLMAGEEE